MLLTAFRSAALALAALPLHGLSAPLALDDALRLAEQRSLQLPAEDAAAAAARDMAIAAAQRPDPVLRAGIDNLPVNGPDRFSLTRDFMTMRSIGVMQEWTRRDKLQARAARFEREAEVAEANRQLALANLQRDTAIAWLERHYLARMRGILVQQRSEAQLQVQATDAAYRGGRGAQADVFAARTALTQIDDRLAAAERELLGARTMLGRWVGSAADDEIGPPPDMKAVRLREEDLDTALQHHPEIAVLQRQEAVARAEADAARANKRPDVNVELMYSQRGPSYSNMVSIGVSMPLPWDQSNRQDRELAAKLAAVERARALREEQTRMHVAEARLLLQQWRSQRERLQRYEAELLPLAAERVAATLAGYRGGGTPLAGVLDARRAELDTRMDRLRLEMESARLWARLNYLVPAAHGNAENAQ
ncbi:MAG TPA: TolC family protein [Ideonella sp.]|jgi:outer membrane protein TolC|nr:TolC family protein [Ideonella sp.]